MKHTGSCLCKSITFEIEGEFENFYLCHCSRCRKDTGSSHASNLFSSSAKIKWISGEDQVKTYKVEESNHSKSFCPNCGSALPTLQMNGSLLVVPAGSLDSDLNISPKGHIFVDSRAKWDNNLETIPHYSKLPDTSKKN